MRRWILPLGIMIIAALAVGSWLLRQRELIRFGGASAASAAATVGVEALMESSDRFPSEIAVRGIVGRVLPDKQLFGLVDLSDRDELLKTGATQCVTLPVRWAGRAPAFGDEVIVRGEVGEETGKFIFVARGVEKAPPGPEGGDLR